MRTENKKAQIAVWIIIALLIATVLILFFVLKVNPVGPDSIDENVKSYVEKCTKDATNEAIEKMIPQGGFIDPINYKMYENVKISYLCQNRGYFKPCVNQHPALINEEITEIEQYITPEVEKRFTNFKSEMERKNYQVSIGPMKLTVSLTYGRVLVDINREVTLSKNEQSQKTETYHVELLSPLYDLSNVAIEIANQQAKYCYFEYVGYMILYPQFDIRVFSMSDSTKIYTIEDKNSNKKMNIAIRSCAIPPGV